MIYLYVWFHASPISVTQIKKDIFWIYLLFSDGMDPTTNLDVPEIIIRAYLSVNSHIILWHAPTE
jgi:hypothetical protein